MCNVNIFMVVGNNLLVICCNTKNARQKIVIFFLAIHWSACITNVWKSRYHTAILPLNNPPSHLSFPYFMLLTESGVSTYKWQILSGSMG